MNDDDHKDDSDAVLGAVFVFSMLTGGFLIAAIVSSGYSTSEKLLLLAVVVAGIGSVLTMLVSRRSR